jgi:hypothetical protein
MTILDKQLLMKWVRLGRVGLSLDWCTKLWLRGRLGSNGVEREQNSGTSTPCCHIHKSIEEQHSRFAGDYTRK